MTGAEGLAAGGWATGFGIRGAEPLLRNLGLLEGSAPDLCLYLTPVGRVLARLPVDVGVGKLLLLSLVFGVQSPAVVLASAMGLHSPRMQRHGERSEGKWSFDHNLGDPFTTHRVYQAWLEERLRQRGGSDEQSRRWCREQAVDERLLFELNKLNVQLCDHLRDGAGSVAQRSSASSFGGRLRKERMSRLEARIAGGSSLSKSEREALERELEELQQKDAVRQRRRLAFEDGQGALLEDERAMGVEASERTLGGWDSDGDFANASGGEGNPNRELNRRKVRGKAPKKKPRTKPQAPENDELVERLRRRNLEFELRYGSHGHTTRALEHLGGRREELLQLSVACALYPNLALPHELNKERCSAECLLHTRQVPFAHLHPSSALYPELPTTLGRHDGLAFGSILQTHQPFVLHVTRCPILPVLLLCASKVDVQVTVFLL